MTSVDQGVVHPTSILRMQDQAVHYVFVTSELYPSIDPIIVGAFVLLKRVVRPVCELTESMAKLARGLWETIVPATQRHDEIGQMARSVEVFKKNSFENVRLQAEQATEQEARLASAERMNRIVGNFNVAVSEIAQTLLIGPHEVVRVQC